MSDLDRGIQFGDGKQVQEKIKERDSLLEQLESAPYTEEVKQQKRKEILETFFEEITEIKKRVKKKEIPTGGYDQEKGVLWDGYMLVDEDFDIEEYYKSTFKDMEKEIEALKSEKRNDEKILDELKGTDNDKARYLIESGYSELLAFKLELFKGLKKNIANDLINLGHGAAVAHHIENFDGIDYNEMADILIKKGFGAEVAYNIKKFKGVNHLEIVNKLFDYGKGVAVAFNMEKFEGVDHNYVAKKLIETGDARVFRYKYILKNFIPLDDGVLRVLVQEGYLTKAD